MSGGTTKPGRIVVVGAGISGLAAARAAADRAREADSGVEVLVLERDEQVGGKARTLEEEGWLLEAGPGSFLDNEDDFRRVVEAAGFEDEQLAADEAARHRYLARDGELREVPTHPLRFATSGLLGPLGLLRVLIEPLIPAVADHRRPRDTADTNGTGTPGQVDEAQRDESVWEFAARRLGTQVADRLVSPMVLGIYAGDARRLSLPAAMPRLASLEREHGSLIKGMLARRRESPGRELSTGPSGKLSSFRRGMQSLPQALASALDITVRCGAPVTAVTRAAERGQATGKREKTGAGETTGQGAGEASGDEPVYHVHVQGDPEPIPAAALILAGEAFAMAGLLRELAPRTAAVLGEIEMPAVTVVGLGYGPGAAETVPRGFGVLVPRSEEIRTLGCVWDSLVFPDRSPESHLLVRAMLGGTVDRGAGDLDEEAALELARREMARLLGLPGEPAFARAIRWPRAIPQYDLDHTARVRTAQDELADRPGLYVAGNCLAGVSFARSGATGWRLGRQAAGYALGLDSR